MKGMKSKKLQKTKRFFVTIADWLIRISPIVAIIIFVWIQNNMIVNREFVYSISNLPKSFVGYTVVHVSDIANSDLDVVKKVKKADPDAILVTGGYNDVNGKNSNSVKTMQSLAKVAPVYYILNTNDTEFNVEGNNIKNITNEKISVSPRNISVEDFIKRNYGRGIIRKAKNKDEEAIAYFNYTKEALANTMGETIDIMGLDLYNGENGRFEAKDKTLELIANDLNRLSILLNGNINNVDKICETDLDIMLFGGTFGTNVASSQYTKGVYGNHGTQLLVSGGIGKPMKHYRFMNFPEIQVITLSDGTISEMNPLEKFIALFWDDVGTIFDADGGFKPYKQHYGKEYKN